ncbi:alkaline phosphatase family protein [Salinifilum ghardaiensis]
MPYLPDWVVPPDPAGRTLAAVLPGLLAAMGARGHTDAVGFPECRNAIVLLVDGLGQQLLAEHAADAPYLSALPAAEPLTAGFPTTTAASISSLGTGRCVGEHGIAGYTFAAPPVGGLLHPLSWSTHGTEEDAAGHRTGLLSTWPPEAAQPRPTIAERLTGSGIELRTVVPAEFAGTGLTRAALRGARLHGVRALGDLAEGMLAAAHADAPTLCYAYHGHVDLLGHAHGPGSDPWRFQLSQVDHLVSSVAERLPSGVSLVVVADHGMVAVDPSEVFDVDTDAALSAGVRQVAGEVRARYVYPEPGAAGDVAEAWRGVLGERGVVLTREQAIDEGWFGPVVDDEVVPRIGEVIAVMRESGVIRSTVEPGESRLLGHHGSVTAAEQWVPVLLGP